MKTCSEYIDESRQNYIFGGTDNRNTNVKDGKAFSSLRKGDKFYVWFNGEDDVLEVTFRSLYSYEEEYVEIETMEDEDFYINVSDIDSDVSYGETKHTKWCIATTFEALQATVHGVYKVKIDKKNITTWQ